MAFSLLFMAGNAQARRYCVKNAWTTSSCACRSGIQSSVMTHRFKRKFSLKGSSSIKRWSCKKANNAAKKRCKKYGGYYIRSFRAQVRKWRVHNVAGFNSGYCTIAYICRWQQKREYKRFTGSMLSHQVYSVSGNSTFKRKGFGNTTKRVICKKATQTAKRYISKKFGHLVSYQQTGYRWKKSPFYGRCTVIWRAKYKKRIPKVYHRCI